MAELLRYLTAYEAWIYVFLGAVGLIYVRKLIIAFQDWQSAIFGLEKNLAQRRLSEAVGIIFLLILLGLGELTVVSFVIPNHPELAAIPTPTLDLLSTPTATLAEMTAAVPSGTGTAAAPDQITGSESSCVPGQLEFTSPKSGDTLKTSDKIVTLHGSVTIPPNFGYYKYEFAPVGSTNWETIQANDHIRCLQKECITSTEVPGDVLGLWDISSMNAGDYLLRLVATDNAGKPLPACQITIHITTS